jgi:hypothetical protein
VSAGHSIDEGGEAHVPATGTREVEYRQKLTVRSLAKKLEEIEADAKYGYERALLCVEMLSYMSLNALVEQGGPDNDPNLMPSRFCILKGATDKGLEAAKNLDPFGPKGTSPKYDLHKSAPHVMSVQNLADLLTLGGYLSGPHPVWAKDPKPTAQASGEATESARKFTEMDDELVDALNVYLMQGTQPFQEGELPKTYKVNEGDSLSSISRELGIRNWRLLWELNKSALGAQWDRPAVGAELKLPNPTKDPLATDSSSSDPKAAAGSFVEWLKDYSSPLEFTDKGYQYPGIYLSLTIFDETNAVAKFDKPIPFSVHLRGEHPTLIHHAEISSGDEIDFVIPDGPGVSWGLKGNPISSLGEAWFYYTEDESGGDETENGLDLNQFGKAESIHKQHVESNKANQK